MTAGPEQPGSFFGRRKGKQLRPGQEGLLRELLPGLRVTLPSPVAASRTDSAPHDARSTGSTDRPSFLEPRTLFDPSPDQVWVEVGFGGGEHLLHQARSHPEIGFIGVEPFVNGVAKLLAHVEHEALQNLRVWDNDVTTLLPALAPASISRVYLLYPDPWPKRRQRKRRLLSQATLSALARVMRPGAELRFATDIDDYAGWALARVLCSPDFAWIAAGPENWRHPWPDWPGTRYEVKARREGRGSAYLTFQRL